MKNAVILIAEGFEEVEAVTIIDTLRRGGVDILSVSVTGDKTVVGAHGIPITCDSIFDRKAVLSRDILVLPGGMPGTKNLGESGDVAEAVTAFKNEGKTLSAICAAPMIFGSMGLLKGLRATIYPGMESFIDGSIITPQNTTEYDGNILTGKGPGLALDFALRLLEIASDKETAQDVAKGMLKEY